MSEDIKRYAPTPRRLEQLRRSGLHPASEAVTATVVLVAASAGLALGGGRVVAWLAGLLAADLQRAVGATPDLAGLLATRLAQAGGVVALVGGVALALAVVVQAVQGKIVQHSSKRMYLPMRAQGGVRRRAGPVLALGPGLVGLGAAVALVWGWWHDLVGTRAWPDVSGLAAVWLRWLVVLGAVATLHAVLVRWRLAQQAQMSHREMQDDLRETEGSRVKRRRRRG